MMDGKAADSSVRDAAQPSDARPSLVGMDLAEIGAVARDMGLPAFRARQLFRWMYGRGVTDFAAMTDIARPVRAALAARWRLSRPAVATDQRAADGTRKWLLRFADGALAETVFIPDGARGTLCISSQVGCPLACAFCHTGTQRLVRNLSAEEIVGQVMLARDALDDWPAAGAPAGPDGPPRRITNVVFMGMGEPMLNPDAVIRAARLITDGEGIGISRRRVTISTAGVVPAMARVGRESRARLAVSLHATRDDLRDVLVPVNRKYPISVLMDAVRAWPGLGNAARVTWEYVMLRGVNDSPADARALVRLIRGIPSKINLIPFNPWPGAPYECSEDRAIARFADIVRAAGYASPVRAPRGRDILAACGQLKSASSRPMPRRAATGAATSAATSAATGASADASAPPVSAVA